MFAEDMEVAEEDNSVAPISAQKLRIDHEPHFVRRDGGPSIFKTGENVTCAIVSFPQRGPFRKDNHPTLTVEYSRSKIHHDRHPSKSDSVEAAKAVLRTLELMLIPKLLPKSRIRCRVISVQHGNNEIESCVNSTALSLLQSSYELRDIITAVSYTQNHTGEDLFFPNQEQTLQSQKDDRPVFRFHFNRKLEVIWMLISGSVDAPVLHSAQTLCRSAAKTILTEMQTAVRQSALH